MSELHADMEITAIVSPSEQPIPVGSESQEVAKAVVEEVVQVATEVAKAVVEDVVTTSAEVAKEVAEDVAKEIVTAVEETVQESAKTNCFCAGFALVLKSYKQVLKKRQTKATEPTHPQSSIV